MISLKFLLAVVLILPTGISAQEYHTNTISRDTTPTFMTPTTLLKVPVPLVTKRSPNYQSYEDYTAYRSSSTKKKTGIPTGVFVCIPLIIAAVIMGGLWCCCASGCGARAMEVQQQQDNNRMNASINQNRTNVVVTGNQNSVYVGTPASQIREPPRVVLRDQNGVTVVEDAPPPYSWSG